MIKRLFWFTAGFALGVYTTWRANQAVRTTVERYLPDPVVVRLRSLNDAIEARQREIRARNRPMRSVG
ncbi:MAG TPA: hypothetical protein VF152_08145 [Acidimicrobiia bacterium]